MISSLFGSALHGVGALSAALCYTPQARIRHWSWQSYWMAQAVVCWLALPILVATITTPHLGAVLHEAPTDAMLRCAVLGFCYGIGGTAFGAAIRFLGFSMTYALSIGTSCVLGTLLPPMLASQLTTLAHRQGGAWVFSGVASAAVSILASGIAGKLRDRDHMESLPANEQGSSRLTKGLLLSLVAGVLSAVFGLALTAGQPIADVANRYGAGQLQGNVILIFACGGAFLSTALVCLFLHWKHKSIREYLASATGSAPRDLSANFGFAALTGLLWYTQFFFYGMAHTYMGVYKFTSWAIHMAMLVFFSMVVGMLLKEWQGCTRQTLIVLGSALTGLAFAIALITYGSYLGSG